MKKDIISNQLFLAIAITAKYAKSSSVFQKY